MASHPPGKCCTEGVKHEGSATGEITTFGDLEVYLKYPANKSTENGILFLTDVFGHRFINAQLIADQLAANGYFVVVPDLFNGDAITPEQLHELDLQKWFGGGYSEKKRPHTTQEVDPVVEKVIKEMRSKYNVKKIGAIGYCFGAKYVVRFLKKAEISVDAGFIAHPSFVDAGELEAINGPLSIAAAEKDTIFPYDKRRESEQILENLELPYEITLYGGVDHGFAVRGDPEDRKIQFAKEGAFFQLVRWFGEYLKL